jgi:hypothetical protein
MGVGLKKFIVLAAVAGVAITAFSSGVAGAQESPDVLGKKYGEAAAGLHGAGYTAKVWSRTGDQIALDDCVITSQRDSSSVFKVGGDKTILLALSCTTVVSISPATPEGRAAGELQTTVAFHKTPEGRQWCDEKRAAYPDWNWDSDPKLVGC